MVEKRRQYLDGHPELPFEFKQAISQGKVLKKMSYEMVVATWGNPMRIEEPADTTDTDEVWVYSSAGGSSTCLCFKEGLVAFWEQPCSRMFVERNKKQTAGATLRTILDRKAQVPLSEPKKGEPVGP